jgi:hypothetical protein
VFDAKENDGFLKNENEAKQSLDMEHFSKQFETRKKKPDDRKIWAQLDLVVSILFCYYLE